MGGSKKGEHRGNARKRAPRTANNTVHERPRDIMREAVTDDHKGTYRGDRGRGIALIDRRIQIAKIIHGQSGSVLDMTPKEVLLAGMHHNMQGVVDWKAFLMEMAAKPITDENTRLVQHAEAEIERLLDKAAEHAHRVMPCIHPRLAAVQVIPSRGDNQADILQDLMDEIDQRERAAPIIVEHVPKRKTA